MRAGPLLVDYPLGGRRFLLHWWTQDDRGHVVIAESERSLLAASKRVFAENPDAEIKAMCEVEIVAPPDRFEKLAALCARQEAIGEFHFMTCSRLHDAHEAGLEIPPPFAFCEMFEKDDEDALPDSWARENHYNCKHCKSRVRLVGMTPEELYAQHAEAWYALHSDDRRNRSDSKKMKSRAARASDADADGLWYARSNFGHHAGGIELREVDLERDVYLSDGVPTPSFTPSCFTEQLMFFFKRLSELDRSKAEAILAAEKEKSKRLHEERERVRKEAFERDRREQNEDVVRFFLCRIS